MFLVADITLQSHSRLCWFDRAHTLAYKRPILTVTLCCTVSEIQQLIGPKLQKMFLSICIHHSSFGVKGDSVKISEWGLVCRKLHCVYKWPPFYF